MYPSRLLSLLTYSSFYLDAICLCPIKSSSSFRAQSSKQLLQLPSFHASIASETYHMTCFCDCTLRGDGGTLPLRAQGQMENKSLFLRLKRRPLSIILQGRTDFISFLWSSLVRLGKGSLAPSAYFVFWRPLQQLLSLFFASSAFVPPGKPGG